MDIKNKFKTYKDTVVSVAERDNIDILNIKDINYGCQIECKYGIEKSKITLYYSIKKKSFSCVISNKNSLSRTLKVICEEAKETVLDIVNEKLHTWKKWIGSDEAGKGDLFGPLVVCAFYCRQTDVSDLQNLGVKDSKALNDSEIKKIATKIKEVYPDRYNYSVLTPIKYNYLYDRFREQNKKLNELLAWAHSKAIIPLIDDFSPEGVFIDKFAAKKVIAPLFGEYEKKCDILLETKGERDIAVAAASILARDKFLKGIAYYSQEMGIKLPLGCGNNVRLVLRDLIQRGYQDKLVNILKLHFKTVTNEILK